MDFLSQLLYIQKTFDVLTVDTTVVMLGGSFRRYFHRHIESASPPALVLCWPVDWDANSFLQSVTPNADIWR